MTPQHWPSPFPPRPSPSPGPFPTPWSPPDPRPAQPETLRERPSALDIELADRLLARRVLILVGELDPATATAAVARLMLLDADSPDPVELHLSCPDGDLQASLVLAETLDLMRCRVTAQLRGTVGGPPLAAVAAADRVVAHPSCLLVLREPSTHAAGRAEQLVAAGEQHARLVGELCERLAAATGRGSDAVAADLRRGRVLTAAQAVDYRLVDELAGPRR